MYHLLMILYKTAIDKFLISASKDRKYFSFDLINSNTRYILIGSVLIEHKKAHK